MCRRFFLRDATIIEGIFPAFEVDFLLFVLCLINAITYLNVLVLRSLTAQGSQTRYLKVIKSVVIFTLC